MKIILIAILTVAILAVGGLVFFRKPLAPASIPSPEPSTISVNNQPLPVGTRDDSGLNVLLLGYGGGSHDGGYLTDAIILVNIKPQTFKMNLVSIPRDLWVEIPGVGQSKINAAYAKGADTAKYVVETVTGLKVNYFIAIDFSKLVSGVDLLGGLDVIVPQSFTDKFYPLPGLENATCGFSASQIAEFHQKYSGFDLEKQFTCRYETLSFTKGVTHMDGATVLKYARSRHSDTYGNDFSRSERQHTVLTALKDKILSLNILSKSNALFKKLVSAVATDISLNSVDSILKTIGTISEYKINHIYLTDQNVLKNSTSSAGAYILIPKVGPGVWSEVQSFLKSSAN